MAIRGRGRNRLSETFHCACGRDLDAHVRQDGCDEEGCHCRKFKVVWDDEIEEPVRA